MANWQLCKIANALYAYDLKKAVIVYVPSSSLTSLSSLISLHPLTELTPHRS